MHNRNEKLEDIVVKQIVDLNTFIKEIETMIALEKFGKRKIKQVIYLPDNFWVWYRWN